METPAVQLRSLGHRYGERVALGDLNLSVPRGCVFALLGPNGSGKSTLFRILATLLTPTSGTALVEGADVTLQQRRVRERIGVVFQKPSVDVYLSVAENLRHQGHLYGLRGGELMRRAGQLMERFGISDRAGDRVKSLSGGLQRRVELAKSLLHRPGVLILDEPSTGLDPGARTGLNHYLAELRDKDGVTSLLTTHLMDEADGADCVAVLDGGRLVAHGAPAKLKAMIGGDVVSIASAQASSLADRISRRFGVPAAVMDGTIRIERPDGHTFVPELVEAFPGEIESVTVGRPTLGDVFQHLTGHRLWDDERYEQKEGEPAHG